MIDDNMVEVIRGYVPDPGKWDDAELAQRLHDAGYRQVPSVEILAGSPLIKDSGNWGGLKIGRHTAKSIHDLMMGEGK